MYKKENIFYDFGDILSEGQNVTFRHTSIYGILLNDPLIGFVVAETDDPDKMLWIILPDDVLVNYLGKEKLNRLKKKLQDKKNSLILFENEYFLHNVIIKGSIQKMDTLSRLGFDVEKGIVARKIEKDSKGDDDRCKGYICFKGKDKSLVFLKDRLRERLAEALEPYMEAPYFPLLSDAVFSEMTQDEKVREFRLFECEECGKNFLVHVFELLNNNDLKILCRSCGAWKYTSLIDVPFGTPMLLDTYFTLVDYFNENSSIPLEKIGGIITSAHPTESGVVRAALRDKLEAIIEPQKAEFVRDVESIINVIKLKNPIEFGYLVESLEEISSKESLQTTSDISRIMNQIRDSFGEKTFEFMFPHPKKRNEDGIDVQNIIHKRFGDILNLYKDIYDLYTDHVFMANLGRIFKGGTFDANCISRELFGKKLVDKTLSFVKATKLECLVKDIYDNTIRRSIGHPGRFIDPETGEVSFLNKGKLVLKLSSKESLARIHKIVNFHMALVEIKYKLAFEDDRLFLSTGGILSLQPEIFDEVESKNPVATVVINQLWCFERFNPPLSWWADNLKMTVENTSDRKQLCFIIKREKSKFTADSPGYRQSNYDITEYIKQWINIATNNGKIEIIHRKCYIPIDISLGEKLPWLPCDIYIDYIQKESIYFIKRMDKSGIIKVTGEIRNQLAKILQDA